MRLSFEGRFKRTDLLLPITTNAELILFLTNLFAIALASKCFFHALLFTRFQIKRVTLNFLDDVLGLHFALETAQGILERFTFLNSNLCQKKYTSQSRQNGYLLGYVIPARLVADNRDKSPASM